jgi:hypothetical protein
VRSARPRRDPASTTIIQPARISLAGVDAPLPALSPPYDLPYLTPPRTRRALALPSIIQQARVTHVGLDDSHPAPSSPHFPSDSTPPPTSGASSPSPELGADDLDGAYLMTRTTHLLLTFSMSTGLILPILLALLGRYLPPPLHIGSSPDSSSGSFTKKTPSDEWLPANFKLISRDTQRELSARCWVKLRRTTLVRSNLPHFSSFKTTYEQPRPPAAT